MKKYFLKSTREEIKVGSKIQLKTVVDTPYGKGVVTTNVVVTDEILKKLVNDGFACVQEEDKSALYEGTLKPYVRRFARKNDLSFPEACLVLTGLLDMSPRAHLTVLVEAIAEVKNQGKENRSAAWYLAPTAHFKPCRTCPSSAGVLFYDVKDAEEAYKLLTPFIEDIVDGK